MKRLPVLALLLLASGCGRDGDPTPGPTSEEAELERTIARVAGARVPAGLFAAYLRDNINLTEDVPRTSSDGHKEAAPTGVLADEVKSRLLDAFLNEQALRGEALAAGITADEPGLDKFARAVGLGPLEQLHAGTTLTEREYLRRYLEDCYVVKTYLDTKVLASIEATDAEAKAYFDTHASRFSRPDRLRLRLIHLDSFAEAKEIQQKIARDPTSFVKVAQSISEGVEGEQGKDLGTWVLDSLPESIAQAVSGLRPGQASEIVQDPDGAYNMYYVEDRIEGGTVAFDQVRDRLRAQLTREKRSEALVGFVAKVQEKVKISINEGSLGFRYVSRAEAEAARLASPPATPATTPPQAGGTP